MPNVGRYRAEGAGYHPPAVEPGHPVRQLTACRRTRQVIVEVNAEHGVPGRPGIAGDRYPGHAARPTRRGAVNPRCRPGDEAAVRFRALAEAYHVLSDPDRRSTYDSGLSPARRPNTDPAS